MPFTARVPQKAALLSGVGDGASRRFREAKGSMRQPLNLLWTGPVRVYVLGVFGCFCVFIGHFPILC